LNDEYDLNDPVQSDLGQGKWDQQVSRACSDLVEKIESAIDEVHNSLHEAEYM